MQMAPWDLKALKVIQGTKALPVQMERLDLKAKQVIMSIREAHDIAEANREVEELIRVGVEPKQMRLSRPRMRAPNPRWWTMTLFCPLESFHSAI